MKELPLLKRLLCWQLLSELLSEQLAVISVGMPCKANNDIASDSLKKKGCFQLRSQGLSPYRPTGTRLGRVEYRTVLN